MVFLDELAVRLDVDPYCLLSTLPKIGIGTLEGHRCIAVVEGDVPVIEKNRRKILSAEFETVRPVFSFRCLIGIHTWRTDSDQNSGWRFCKRCGKQQFCFLNPGGKWTNFE